LLKNYFDILPFVDIIIVGSGVRFPNRIRLIEIDANRPVLFLPLFVFMPKLVQCAMKADADAVIDAFGKNEQVKRVFWTLFVAMAGLVMAQVVDPVTAQRVVGIIAGIGV
jgi:hypothetical protein